MSDKHSYKVLNNFKQINTISQKGQTIEYNINLNHSTFSLFLLANRFIISIKINIVKKYINKSHII